MFKCPPMRHLPHRVRPLGVAQRIWILFSLCTLMIAMVKPAHAVVEQVPPLTGGNQYVASPQNANLNGNPLFVRSTPVEAYLAFWATYGFTPAANSLIIQDQGVPNPNYPYLHNYVVGTGSAGDTIWVVPNIPQIAAICPVATPVFTFNPITNFCERPILTCPLHAHVTNLPTPPCACDVGYVWDATQTSCLPEQFTLTLNGPAGDLEPTGTTATGNLTSKVMSVYVENQLTKQPKAGAIVRVTLGVVFGSGGHVVTSTRTQVNHDDAKRPKGTLIDAPMCNAVTGVTGSYDCKTGADGYAGFTFQSDQVSGTHTISAVCTNLTCTNDAASSNPVTLDVKVPRLSPIPSVFPLYVLEESNGIGGVKSIGGTNEHPNVHGATAGAIAGLYELALKYHSAINPGAGLYINDASLSWGGLLDINSNWNTPHSSHRLGNAIDIRAQSTKGKLGEVPSSMFLQMQQSSTAKIEVQIHCYNAAGNLVMAFPKGKKYPKNACDNLPDGRHFHVNFM